MQPILEALEGRRRVDLADPAFRWDARQAAPTLGAWAAASGAGGPAYGGLSKRQLELASFEALLLASRGGAAPPPLPPPPPRHPPPTTRSARRARCARSARSSTSARSSSASCARRSSAAPPPAPAPSRAARSASGSGCCAANAPAAFETDSAFSEWQERQAAFVGASLHALLARYTAEHLGVDFEEEEMSPASGMGALVDAQFMELLSIAHPTPHGTELRRSEGFAAEAYRACLERTDALYATVLQLATDGAAADPLVGGAEPGATTPTPTPTPRRCRRPCRRTCT